MARIEAFPSTLAEDWQRADSTAAVSLWWLGQAGFLLRAASVRIAIDPYLSDSLARKYAGTRFPHQRMMPPPIASAALHDLDYVLCTHRHSDHMDPETLLAIRDVNLACRFVVPAAERQRAIELGLPAVRVIGIDAGESMQLSGDVSLSAIASAHEDLSRDAAGRHHFLGYMLKIGDATLYHSGDCVPYAGLLDAVRAHSPDLALLPINGRDDARRRNGVPGNFTLAEAINLAEQAGIATVIAHHFSMFAFNTVNAEEAKAGIVRLQPRSQVMLAETGLRYDLR